MSNNIPTPHIEAKRGEIRKTVLMPGDPLRAKYIAENFLEDVICFNKVRGILGFSGKFNGRDVSVMASGMGVSSIGIYSYELYNFYDVENIIRIGTCGGMAKDMKVGDVILADRAYSDSVYAKAFAQDDADFFEPSAHINDKITEKGRDKGIEVKRYNVMSSVSFYAFNNNYPQYPWDLGAVEMEAFALFANAKYLGKNAACLLTVSDLTFNEEKMPSIDREKSLNKMIELALESVIEL